MWRWGWVVALLGCGNAGVTSGSAAEPDPEVDDRARFSEPDPYPPGLTSTVLTKACEYRCMGMSSVTLMRDAGGTLGRVRASSEVALCSHGLSVWLDAEGNQLEMIAERPINHAEEGAEFRRRIEAAEAGFTDAEQLDCPGALVPERVLQMRRAREQANQPAPQPQPPHVPPTPEPALAPGLSQPVMDMLCTQSCAGPRSITLLRDADHNLGRILFKGDVGQCSHVSWVWFDPDGTERLSLDDHPVGSEEQAAENARLRGELQAGLLESERLDCPVQP